MNWGRAKTILIILFLVIDLFLLVVLIQTRSNADHISKTAIIDAVTALEQRGITVAAEDIPDKRIQNLQLVMTNAAANPQKLAETLLGDKAEEVFSDVNSYTYTYKTPLETVTVEDGGFSFQSGKEKKSTQGISPADIKETVGKALDKRGFSRQTMYIYGLKEENGLWTGHIRPVYEGSPIYGITLTFTADREDIISLQGHWFYVSSTENGEEETLTDISAVLVGMAYREKIPPMDIAQINNAYYVAREYTNNMEVVAVPVYALKDESGVVHLVNPKQGTMLK